MSKFYIEFDLTTPIGLHAKRERELTLHRAQGWVKCDGNDCDAVRARDRSYEAYTKQPHVSRRGGHGSS